MARTITAPGVEIFERDESETSSLQAGTAILVQGFAHQGPTNELIHISTKEELNQVYFGGNGPTNDAEQYFYHSCAEILNSPANLYTIRLPYGLDSGDGFSGKYVALAYGGSIDAVPVTKTVHRYVKKDDFIPGDINTSGHADLGTDVYLYEFSKNSVLPADEEDVYNTSGTSAFYEAVKEFVSRNFKDFDPETDDIFDEKYASAFTLENDQFWINKEGDAYAIDISPKTNKVCKTYRVPGYKVDKLEFKVPAKRITILNPDIVPDLITERWNPATVDEPEEMPVVKGVESPVEASRPSIPASLHAGTAEEADLKPEEVEEPDPIDQYSTEDEKKEYEEKKAAYDLYKIKEHVYNEGVTKYKYNKTGTYTASGDWDEKQVKSALVEGTFGVNPEKYEEYDGIKRPRKVTNPEDVGYVRPEGPKPYDESTEEGKMFNKYDAYLEAQKKYDEFLNKMAIYNEYKAKLDANLQYLWDLQAYYLDQKAETSLAVWTEQKARLDKYKADKNTYDYFNVATGDSTPDIGIPGSGFSKDQTQYDKYGTSDYVDYLEKQWDAAYSKLNPDTGKATGEALIDTFDLTVTFNNVGEITDSFIEGVLNDTISLYDEENERVEKTTDTHPFQGLKYLYARKKDKDGNIFLYRIEYGRSLETWKEQIAEQLESKKVNFERQIAYPDPALANVYMRDAKNKRVLAGLDENGKQTLIVDTEAIADRIVDVLCNQIDNYNYICDDVYEVRRKDITGIEFENGIPMQDALTQLESYTGPFTVEPIDPKSYVRRYTINHYDNKLVTERIKEIEVEEPERDSEGNIIYKNVLTMNPVPVALPLSEYQYTAIGEGAIKWAKPVYSLDGEGTGYDAFRTVLGKSAFYVINKMQTSLDDKYQGFYVAMMDRTKFVEKAYGTLKNSYDAIKQITYVSSPDEQGDVTIEVLPERAYHFDISGPESLSTDIMSKANELDLSQQENFDNIVVATVRCGRRASSSDPSKLSYDLKDVTMGSFNVGSTIIDRITKGRVPNRIDTKMKENDYMEFVINEKFELTKYVPKEVKFGGRDYPNRDQESGTCCSLGLEIPCEEENTAEYIGSVPNKIEKALSLCDNIYEFDLDILIDAGLSTIWAYVAEDSLKPDGTTPGDCEFNATKYIENNKGTNYELLTRSGDDYAKSLYYLCFDAIRKLFNDFCQKTRKDCMYLLDPIRAVFVRGRDTKMLDIDGKIFTLDVYRPLKNLFSNANSSYGASYANWVKIYDSFNDKYVWMPSSPFEASIMATVDANFYPWYAPYGLNNGILSSISDIALRFSPKQQDDIYKMGLNMFVFFNGDGFVSWGQKTLQTKASAFDRINVRRLFLVLERATFKTVRYFIAEPNTTFTRTRVVSALTPLFDTAKNNEGCYDYKIYCNETNNTPQVIDNNELVIDIYIKPTRIIDFIEVTFHATKTDANFDELFNG